MILEPITIVELAALGLTGGFMAGLLGVGGGMVLVPFITWILASRGVDNELAVKMAIATSMATIIFTSISSVRAHHKRGMVRWDLVKGIAPGIMIGALVVSIGVFALLKGAWLSVVFGVLVILAALQMFLDRKPKPTRQMPGRGGQMAAGSVIGFLSGLLGAGGGFLSVPFMTWCNVAIHNAVATSAALGFPIAVFNVIGYVLGGWSVAGRPEWSVGYVWLPALAVIASCSVLMAPLGARTAHALPVKTLKRIFAGILMLLAVSMLIKGIRLLGA
ncbi:MAG: sulfite exporter TauE/SafE family protein [Brachymonas denitrificans]|uniref:sulfite exporter TauE/SafE family protein n=1 Tax=Brachymonas denitrificans TaxID=28220 RepID=UPI001BD01C97|nr:sulfite exporter TauE/SafE family protein [Brachymonas denitrificans]